ncbi:sensor histidine kinase [Bradyrhizobium niftali]|jgi:two-component system sensor histidine kinase TctE|uniref:histidine kinase n=1 Tax=Bradyrhizobium niftali TaxID=2560055 RepID=A0A4Y9M8C0_9BRAD|nr:sensor histidine kinase [Bradyrhizobium niftali]TFV51268.1 sensor histidine kinase [Bradyrhizobium niftali]
MARGQPSLKTRFLVGLLVPVSCIAVAVAVGGSLVISHVVEVTHDRLLKGSLLAIAERLAVEDGEVTVDLPRVALSMLETQSDDSVFYRVSADGQTVTGYSDLPLPRKAALEPEQPIFWDDSYGGNAVRIAAISRHVYGIAKPVLVTVAETEHAREQLWREMIRELAMAEIVLLAVIALLTWLAVERGLGPLAQLKRQIDRRGIRGSKDFQPLDLQMVPKEALAPAQAINELLDRVSLATQILRQFTADASHQMRTPLAALRTHLDLLKRRLTGSSEMTEMVMEVDAQVVRLDRMISQLLTLARADEDALVRSPSETISLVTKAKQILALRAQAAAARNIELQLEVEQDEMSIEANELLVDEVFGNVIDNAIRYGAAGGVVIARVSRDGETGVVDLEDDGPGIPPAERQKVFERFYRIARPDAPDGSGLGLSIVRVLLDRMGGSIELGEGKRLRGLRVTMRFRLA